MDRIRAAAHEVQRPVFYAIIDHHQRLLTHFHSAARRGALVQADGLDRGVCSIGSNGIFDDDRARPGKFLIPQRNPRVAQSGDCLAYETLSAGPDLVHPSSLGDGRRCGAHRCAAVFIW